MRTRNEFLARPRERVDRSVGTIKYPGFHTTKNFNSAACYGLIKSTYGDKLKNHTMYATDYPVVVGLDMSGLEKLTDFDANKFYGPILEEDIFRISTIGENPLVEEIIEISQEIIDEREASHLELKETVNNFSDWAQSVIYNENPLLNLKKNENFLELIIESLETKKISNEMLMLATDQYRYMKNVSEKRIINIHYVKPIIDGGIIQKGENIKQTKEHWPHYEALTYKNYMTYVPKRKLIHDVNNCSELEYHGTTYNRLLKAAPLLCLPTPPPPFRSN